MADVLLCTECKKPLPKGAKLCTECSSYQNWRRYLFQWSGVLTAALAIVPLWTGAYSLWKLAFPEPARVSVTVGGCAADHFLLHFTNSGGAPAILGSPSVEHLSGNQWIRFDMDFPMDEDDLVLEPNESDVVALRPVPADASFSEEDNRSCQLRASFQVISGEAERSTLGAPCTCST